MTKGSTKPKLHKIAAACRGLARALNTELDTCWVPREHNQKADDISKQIDYDSWSISISFFNKLQRLCQIDFTLDAFADDQNFKVSRFFSKHWCPGSAGVDALLQDWRGEVVLAVPPPRLLLQVLMKFQESEVRGILAYPECSSGLLLAGWKSPKLVLGTVHQWKFPGKNVLHSDIVTSYNSDYNGKIVVQLIDFTK
jgi:hypothetical protein